MSTYLSPAEYASADYMSSTGTIPANAVQSALDMAESDISRALGYPPAEDGSPTFASRSWTDEFPWPTPNHSLLLKVPRVISITTVTALHDVASCDCNFTELTGCAFLFQPVQGVVQFRSCEWVESCWNRCRCPHRVRVTYTAGFVAASLLATTPTGQRIRQAIALRARAIMKLKDHYTEGHVAVSSYSSIGYSEKREFERTAQGRGMGMGMLDQEAADMLDPLIVRRGGGIMLRGH